jgi:CRISPR-associated protein Csb2
MLAVEMRLLTGRYVATAYNDRTRAEWPPHPSRLFSAAVAVCAEATGSVNDDDRTVLEWWEAAGAPEIAASEAAVRDVVTVFVPVNDNGAVAGLDEKYALLNNARDRVTELAAELETLTDPAPRKAAEKALDKAVNALEKETKAWEVRKLAATQESQSVPSEGQIKSGIQSLPDLRIRQPRTFPSVTPDDPVVVFSWPEVTATAEQLLKLDEVLSRVSSVGHSASLVSVRVVEESAEPTWVPNANGGRVFRATQSGQLTALEQAYERHGATHPRVLPAQLQAYSKPAEKRIDPMAESCFGRDWLVLRRVDGPRLPLTAASRVATQVRRTLMKFADGDIPELLSGHSPDGSASQRDHLAIVPLPFVGSKHATGLLLGVGLVFPENCDPADRRRVHRAVALWEKNKGRQDEDEEIPPVPLYGSNENNPWWLQRLDEPAAQTTLRPSSWCGVARQWASATPVALDRHPGNIWSHKAKEREAGMRSLLETVGSSCARIGLPDPVSVEVEKAPVVSASEPALAFGAWPLEEDKPSKMLVHLRLTFATQVRGPLLLGAGRYVGLGLFKPVEDHE